MIPNLTGNISSLMNVVPLPGAMTIIPIAPEGPLNLPVGLPYVAMFNPENFNERTDFQYDCEQAYGDSQGTLRFDRVRQSEVQFDFLIDGTGASGDKREVMAEIELFRVTTGFNGDRHMPNFLVLIWGSFIFYGFLKTLDIQYTLFRPNGTPLRAKLRCGFKASTTNILRVLSMGLLSPDLTREHNVKVGDRLDNLSQRYYEHPRHHISLAQANGLSTIRKLKEGDVLFMPPLEK
ncbi:MAG: hypothetical protein SFV22_02020 [Saprospiraceae bacterium]|nr:hypothetical protein [Saprospiraceae bacterium]